MEVAGLTASIITLIGAATLAGSTVSRIWGLRDAPPLYVQTALNEVNDFKVTLQLVQYALESLPDTTPDFIDEGITRFLGRAQTSLAAFNAYLHGKVFQESADDSNVIRLRRRAKLKEILGEAQSEMSTLQQELASIKLSLNTALTAMQIRNYGRLALSIQHVHVIRSGSTTTLSAGDSTSMATFMEKVIASSTTGATQDLPTAASRDEIVVIEAQSTQRRCQKQCPCQCHKMSESSSPQWLQGLIGSAFCSFTGVPFLNRRPCNFGLCANGVTRNGNIHVQYTFPAWLLPVAIEVTASWRCLGGIGGTWSLRIPRILDFETRKIKFIFEQGTVKDLEIIMHEYGIRAFDRLDGWCTEPTLFELAVGYGRVDFGSMLLSAGVDFGHQNRHGITIGQNFWLEAFNQKRWQELGRTPELIESRDNLSLVPGHDLVLNELSEDLAGHIKRNRAHVLAQDSYGLTLLHWAVQCADQKTVDVLLEAGANVNAICRQGQSALMYAVLSANSGELCETLIKAGADLNITDRLGFTVLAHALRKQPTCNKTIELLLQAGSDVHHKTYSEISLLSRAVRSDASARACALLLDFGAELDRTDINGWSPAAYAVYLNRHDVLELFVQRGAALNHLIKRGYSRVAFFAAFAGDVRTMQILTKAKIVGLPMTLQDREKYWNDFERRDEYFVGLRQSLDVERAAFQALLNSITPLDPDEVPNETTQVSSKDSVIPGSFPLDDDDEEKEDAVGNEVCTDDQVVSSGDDGVFSLGNDSTPAPDDTHHNSDPNRVMSIIHDDDEANNPEEERIAPSKTSHHDN